MTFRGFLESEEGEPLKALVNELRLLYPGLKLWAFESDNKIEVQQIEVPPDQRGGGIGSNVMRRIQQYAQAVGKPIVLRPEPDRGKKAALERFYKRLGFVYNTGRNRDDTLSSMFAKTMFWRPPAV